MTIVREFHEAFDMERPPHPTVPDDRLLRLRMRLIAEEFDEVQAEMSKLAWQVRVDKPIDEQLETLGALLKELADLRYVVEGAAVAFGLDIEEAYARVHRSNMSKLGEDGRPIRRADGKILKGPNYAEPDLTDLVPNIVEGTYA